ncbi:MULTISPECIES: CopL family metal-binding regulatory protein [Lysobacter]|uniref:CopL family metal-binding regulatory protein n=1 Tax=Lysobacter TaxID=68 RepID=UPI0004D02DA0|nr:MULTISPECIES: CopL family metal-binding regulatory protein [Lysobacter]
MTYFPLLLRVLLIVAISLNGYAAATMSVGGAHAMHASSTPMAMPPLAEPAMATGTQTAMDADCHDMGAAPAHAAQPQAPAEPDQEAADDCCGKFRCQCDCLQAVAIVRIALPVPPQLSNTLLALPVEAAAPSGVSSLPIRPPIA